MEILQQRLYGERPLLLKTDSQGWVYFRSIPGVLLRVSLHLYSTITLPLALLINLTDVSVCWYSECPGVTELCLLLCWTYVRGEPINPYPRLTVDVFRVRGLDSNGAT